MTLNERDILKGDSDPSLDLLDNSLIVALENIRSVENVGAIIRTAKFFGVKTMIGIGYTPSPDHPKIKKTSMNCEQSINWLSFENSNYFFTYRNIHFKNHVVIAAETSKKADLLESYHFPTNPCILLFGNEVNGLALNTLELVDQQVRIPSSSFKNSLNVATCAGIFLYARRFHQSSSNAIS